MKLVRYGDAGGAEAKAKLEEIIKRGYKLNGVENVAADEVTAKAKVLQERIHHLHSKLKDKFESVPPPRTSWRLPQGNDGTGLCWAAEPVQLVAA